MGLAAASEKSSELSSVMPRLSSPSNAAKRRTSALNLVESRRVKGLMRRNRFILDSRVPFVPLILPIAPLPATDTVKRLDQFDLHHILRLFVPELTLEAEPKRGTV